MAVHLSEMNYGKDTGKWFQGTVQLLKDITRSPVFSVKFRIVSKKEIPKGKIPILLDNSLKKELKKLLNNPSEALPKIDIPEYGASLYINPKQKQSWKKA